MKIKTRLQSKSQELKMKKLLLVFPLLLSCKHSVEDVELSGLKLPPELKGLKIVRIHSYGEPDPIYIPILDNPLHDKRNLTIVNKSNNEIIVVDELVSRNDSILVFKIKSKINNQ